MGTPAIDETENLENLPPLVVIILQHLAESYPDGEDCDLEPADVDDLERHLLGLPSQELEEMVWALSHLAYELRRLGSPRAAQKLIDLLTRESRLEELLHEAEAEIRASARAKLQTFTDPQAVLTAPPTDATRPEDAMELAEFVFPRRI